MVYLGFRGNEIKEFLDDFFYTQSLFKIEIIKYLPISQWKFITFLGITILFIFIFIKIFQI